MEIDWGNLGFGYMKTDFNIRCTFSNGAWGIWKYTTANNDFALAATSLHYGQESFEGLKAFVGKMEKSVFSVCTTMLYVCRIHVQAL